MTSFAYSLSFDEVKETLAEYSSDGKRIISAAIDYRDSLGNYDVLISYEETENFSQTKGESKFLKASAVGTAP